MKKFTAIIISLLVLASFDAKANETEDTIEKALEQRIEQLSKSLNKYKEMKVALKDSTDREATLRKATARLRRQTASVDTALDSLDFYLEVQQIRKSDNTELNKTNNSISHIKDQIRRIRRVMIAGAPKTLEVAVESFVIEG